MALTQITEKGIKDGEILNADINASAAIARTKLANVDLVDDTSPQLGGDLDTNSQNIAVTAGNNITMGDNSRLRLGASNDLDIYHDGTDSILKNSTGKFEIQSDQFRIRNAADSKILLSADNNANVYLYYNNSEKLKTENTGVAVTGQITQTSAAAQNSHKFGSATSFLYGQYNSSGDASINNQASANLLFATANTERMRIDSSGAIRIGHTDAIGSASADNLVIGTGSGNNGLTVYSANDSQGRIDFRDTTGTSDGQGIIFYQHATDSLQIHTNSAERMRIDSSGKLAIGNTSPQQLLHVWPDAANTTSSYVRVTAGDRNSGTGLDLGHDSSGNCHVNAISNAHLIFSSNNTERMRVLNGGGLTFNGDTSSANALDDYEEGTFTPAFKATSASNNSDTTVQESRYVKIGGLVFVTMFIDMNAHGNNTGGNVNITGLPYTASGRHYPVTVGYFNNLLQNQTILTGTVQPGTNLILLRHATGASSALGGFDYSNAIGTSSEMIVSAVYCSV